MSTRIGQISITAFQWTRRTTVGKVVLIAAVVAVLLLYVGEKVKIYRLGYQIEDLKKEKAELERANRALTVEASSLKAPARIEEIAVKRLGMVRPKKEDIVVVRRRSERDGE